MRQPARGRPAAECGVRVFTGGESLPLRHYFLPIFVTIGLRGKSQEI
jgi:hypothetical protein